MIFFKSLLKNSCDLLIYINMNFNRQGRKVRKKKCTNYIKYISPPASPHIAILPRPTIKEPSPSQRPLNLSVNRSCKSVKSFGGAVLAGSFGLNVIVNSVPLTPRLHQIFFGVDDLSAK